MSMRECCVDDYGMVLTKEIVDAIVRNYNEKHKDEEPVTAYELNDVFDNFMFNSDPDGVVLQAIEQNENDSDWGTENSFDEFFYIPLNKYPSLFKTAYRNIQECVDEILSSEIAEYFPNGINIADYLFHIQMITLV